MQKRNKIITALIILFFCVSSFYQLSNIQNVKAEEVCFYNNEEPYSIGHMLTQFKPFSYGQSKAISESFIASKSGYITSVEFYIFYVNVTTDIVLYPQISHSEYKDYGSTNWTSGYVPDEESELQIGTPIIVSNGSSGLFVASFDNVVYHLTENERYSVSLIINNASYPDESFFIGIEGTENSTITGDNGAFYKDGVWQTFSEYGAPTNYDFRFAVYGDNSDLESNFDFTYTFNPEPENISLNYWNSFPVAEVIYEQGHNINFIGTLIESPIISSTYRYCVYSTSTYILNNSESIINVYDNFMELMSYIESETPIINSTFTANSLGIGTLTIPISVLYYKNSVISFTGYIVFIFDDSNNSIVTPTFFIIKGLEPSYTFELYISGGLYNNKQVLEAPNVLVLNQGTYYYLKGYIFTGGSLVENGTYTLDSSAITTDVNIFDMILNYTYDYVFSENIINGEFDFAITPRTLPSDVYQIFRLSFTTTNIETSYYRYYDIIYVTKDSNSTFKSPSPTPIQEGLGTVNPIFPPELIGAFILIIVFALIFGCYAGKEGLIVGLIIGIFISSITSLLPSYGLILCVILGAVLVVSNTGITHTTSGGG